MRIVYPSHPNRADDGQQNADCNSQTEPVGNQATNAESADGDKYEYAKPLDGRNAQPKQYAAQN